DEPPPDVDLLRVRIAEEILNLLPTWMVRQYLVIPLRKEGNSLVVAIDDPAKEGAMAAVRDHTGLEVRAVRADRDALIARYTMHYRL
ncbi:MAG: type II/IV secretion system protein, partial [Deltaproteobacteria bacterium]|nr:type II/IV secretion system protein [Deltaproteobacteria bacterium]